MPTTPATETHDLENNNHHGDKNLIILGILPCQMPVDIMIIPNVRPANVALQCAGDGLRRL